MSVPHWTRPLRVLLVDDCPDSAETMAELVRAWGHDVLVASDGATALGLAAGHTPDVVVLDVGLPDMNGLDLARQLRERLAPDTFLVALTGHERPPPGQRNDTRAVDVYRVKPVDLDEFEGLLAARLPLGVPAT